MKSNELFTEDVLQQLVFMKEIKELARTYASFRIARDEYRSNISSGISHARKHSNVKDAIDKDTVLLTAVDKKLQEITSIQLNRSSLLSTQSRLSVQRKCALVTEAVLQFPTVTKELLSLIRRLRVRNQQVAHRLRDDVTAKVLAEEKDILLCTVLGTSKSWHDCVAEAIEVESSADSKTGALTQRQLVSCVDRLQTSSVLPLSRLLEEIEEEYEIPSDSLVASAPAIEDQLLACFPLLSAKQRVGTSKYANTMLIDAWEFVLPSSGLLQDLFTPPSADGVVTPSPTIVATESVATDQGGKRGRKAHHIMYLSMAKCALEFLQQHGWSAQERRRSCIANSVGVSLESLRNHLLATIPELKEKGISHTTVHQLLLPPRQKSYNAARYHSIVQARVPGKRNEEASHDHQHVHHCAVQVNLCMEFAAEHYDEIMSFSCDDMNKINIGAMAVSRYHQIRRFFVAGDEPNYPDHDFPLKNNKNHSIRLFVPHQQGFQRSPTCSS